MQLKVGQRWRSAGSPVEVIVIRAGTGEVALTCGGEPMAAADGRAAAPPGSAADGPQTQIGKRYTTTAGDLELLCVKGGAGELAADGVPLTVKESKSLPASD
jgi:hypothetical protein